MHPSDPLPFSYKKLFGMSEKHNQTDLFISSNFWYQLFCIKPQEAMLKEELRNMERSKKREGVDMTYLKNVIVKLLETGILPGD